MINAQLHLASVHPTGKSGEGSAAALISPVWAPGSAVTRLLVHQGERFAVQGLRSAKCEQGALPWLCPPPQKTLSTKMLRPLNKYTNPNSRMQNVCYLKFIYNINKEDARDMRDKVKSNIRTCSSLKVALVPAFFKFLLITVLVLLILGARDHLLSSVHRRLASMASHSWTEFSHVTIMPLHNSSC